MEYSRQQPTAPFMSDEEVLRERLLQDQIKMNRDLQEIIERLKDNGIGPPSPQPIIVQPQPIVVQQQPPTPIVLPAIIRRPVCPSCNAAASFRENFTCLGICLGIYFFPIGLICCWLLKEQKCVHCGYTNSSGPTFSIC